MNKTIDKYIDRCIENINMQLSRDDISNTAKNGLQLRLEAYEDIKDKFRWGSASEETKQSKRILQLAKLREQDLETKDQINEINLYSKIREVIPYIMAVSYKINMEEKHLTEELLNFCETQLEIIDSSPFKRKIVFPTKEDIEKAFICYTRRIKPNKIPSLKVYKQPEVSEKIEELYQMFLNVAR